MELGQDQTQRIDRMLDLKRFIGTLEHMDAAIYCLKTIEGMTYKKISDFLFISYQSVRRSFAETTKKYERLFKK